MSGLTKLSPGEIANIGPVVVERYAEGNKRGLRFINPDGISLWITDDQPYDTVDEATLEALLAELRSRK